MGILMMADDQTALRPSSGVNDGTVPIMDSLTPAPTRHRQRANAAGSNHSDVALDHLSALR